MPGEGLTHGPPAIKKAGGSYHRFSRIIRHSLRDGFNAYSALSLETGLDCPHRPRIVTAGLASASGGQDHTPSQSALATLVLRRHLRPSHPASHVVTIAIRPSCRGGTAHIKHLIWGRGQDIF